MWLCETFGIETVEQLYRVAVVWDLLIHFVSSGFLGWLAWLTTRCASIRLFLLVKRPRSLTAMEGLGISLSSLSVGASVSLFVHCWVDFGLDGLLSRLNFIF